MYDRSVTDATASLADHRSYALSGHPSLHTLGMELRINTRAVFDFSGCAGLRAMNLTLWKVSRKPQLSLCSMHSSRCYNAAAARHSRPYDWRHCCISGSGILDCEGESLPCLNVDRPCSRAPSAPVLRRALCCATNR